jgi:hypothetical protein
MAVKADREDEDMLSGKNHRVLDFMIILLFFIHLVWTVK